MTKLLGVPMVFIEWFEVVKLVVILWIIDVQFVRVYSHNWPSSKLLKVITLPAETTYRILCSSFRFPMDIGPL